MGHAQSRRLDGFPQSCFNVALQRGGSLYLPRKDTILKAYDGRFRDIFHSVYDIEFAGKFSERSLTYVRRLIDDMIALALK